MSRDNPFTKAASVVRAGGVGGLGRGRSSKEPVHTSIADQPDVFFGDFNY